MAITKKRVRAKISWKDQLEKRRVEIEEVNTRVLVIQELRMILSQTIEDDSSPFQSNEQKRISILTDEEKLLIKNKMLYLVNKYFK